MITRPARSRTHGPLSLCASLALATLAHGFTPLVNLISPRGGERGTEVVVTLIGDRLQEPEELILYQPGITVTKLEPVGEDYKKLKATISIAPGAALGEHAMRLRCKGGVSYLRTLWVGQFPVVTEATRYDKKRERSFDLNDGFDAPQVISPNTTVAGVIKAEDVDYYRVTGKKGERLSVEIEAMRLGRVVIDPYLAILDRNRFELVSSDDSSLLRRDAACSLVLPEDGDYTILVRESSYQGSDQSQYRLHVGNFPRPSTVYPPGALPGVPTTVTLIGDPLEPGLTATLTPSPESEVHELFAESAGLFSPSPIPIRVSPLPFHNELEPNDSIKIASPAEAPAVPCAFHGILSATSDVDWFRFHGKKGQKLRVKVLARELRSPLDSQLVVRDAAGKVVGQNDDETPGNPDSRVDFEPAADGDYFLLLQDHLTRSGPDFTYRIEVTERGPALSAGLPYAERNQSQELKMIAIPRGGQVARQVTVTRENTRGEAILEAPTLPPGVTLRSEPIPGSVNALLAVFEAAPDAPLSGGLYPLSVRDPASGLVGPMREIIHHLEVNNLGVFHSTKDDRHCVAVIEKAPFELALEIPPVPLVRNGVMRLKILVHRDEEYAGSLKVTLPWKPPGIGAPAVIDIKGDQNEAFMEINANGEAPIRDWQICAQAVAQTPRGPVVMSTPLQPLRVAEPYLAVTIELAASQPSQDVDLLCKVEHLHEFPGSAQLALLGLPHGVTAPTLDIAAGQKEIVFPLTVADDARVGKHGNIFAVATVQQDGHPIRHTVGSGGVLRLDPPPKVEEKPKATPETTKAPAEKPKKPLSRLEQLRQQAQQ